MFKKAYLLLLFVTIIVIASIGQKDSTFINYKDLVKSSCLIVRVPVYANKINLLTQKISETDSNPEYKSILKKELDATITNNDQYLDLVMGSFDQYFHFKEVYFLPDSAFKSHLAGRHTGFINKKGELDKSLQCKSDEHFYFITGKDDDQLLFVDKFLVRPSFPLPHKKNIFFPSFKKLFNRTNYIHKQVIYFNEKLSKL
jgi:hypothetical protein